MGTTVFGGGGGSVWEALICISYIQHELEVEDTTDTRTFASYLDLHLEIATEEDDKKKLYDKRDDLIFQQSTSLSSTFHHHLRMEFIFHNSYIILGMHSTEIFCTELSC